MRKNKFHTATYQFFGSTVTTNVVFNHVRKELWKPSNFNDLMTQPEFDPNWLQPTSSWTHDQIGFNFQSQDITHPGSNGLGHSGSQRPVLSRPRPLEVFASCSSASDTAEQAVIFFPPFSGTEKWKLFTSERFFHGLEIFSLMGFWNPVLSFSHSKHVEVQSPLASFSQCNKERYLQSQKAERTQIYLCFF